MCINRINEHHTALLKAINGSEFIWMAVAFVKTTGVNLLYDSLRKAARRNCSIRIVCGLDFALTDPTALRKLRNLSVKYPCLEVYIASPQPSKQIFHPKIYLFVNGGKATLITGSANLTSGGLKTNNECSVRLQLSTHSSAYAQAVEYFTELLNSEYCEIATPERIKEYKAFYQKQQLRHKKIKAKALPHSTQKLFNYHQLLKKYQQFKQKEDIKTLFQERLQHYQKARRVLDEIATTHPLSKAQFIDLFEQLVGSKTKDRLWHSGSIYRKKTSVFNYPVAFQKLVQFIRNHKDQPAGVVFAGARQLVESIRGSGVNTVTEIMMSYNTKDFANLNANPIKVLREIGEAPINAHRNSYQADNYADYCVLVKAVSAAFGFRNMLEADCFFNHVYWKIKKKKKTLEQ